MAIPNGVPDAAALQQELARSLATNSSSQALKIFDTLIKHAEGSESVQLLCNRAFCYEKLQLNRKALKVRIMTTTLMGTASIGPCLCMLSRLILANARETALQFTGLRGGAAEGSEQPADPAAAGQGAARAAAHAGEPSASN